MIYLPTSAEALAKPTIAWNVSRRKKKHAKIKAGKKRIDSKMGEKYNKLYKSYLHKY